MKQLRLTAIASALASLSLAMPAVVAQATEPDAQQAQASGQQQWQQEFRAAGRTRGGYPDRQSGPQSTVQQAQHDEPTQVAQSEHAQTEMQREGEQRSGQPAPAEEQVRLMQMRVSELEGRTVYNREGQELGNIEQVVQSNQAPQRIAAILEVGGFLGIGSKQVDIPVDQLQMHNGQLIASTSASEDELQSRPAYDEQAYHAIRDTEQTLAQLTGTGGRAAPETGSELAGFEQLDHDGDGQISPQEALQRPQLAEQFEQHDRNQDGQLDRAEFSAFQELVQGEDKAETGSAPAPDSESPQDQPGNQPPQPAR